MRVSEEQKTKFGAVRLSTTQGIPVLHAKVCTICGLVSERISRRMLTGTHSSLLSCNYNRNRILIKHLGRRALGEPWLWAIWKPVHFLPDQMQKHEQHIRKTKKSQEEFPYPSLTLLHLESQRAEIGHRTARHAGALRVPVKVLNTR